LTAKSFRLIIPTYIKSISMKVLTGGYIYKREAVN